MAFPTEFLWVSTVTLADYMAIDNRERKTAPNSKIIVICRDDGNRAFFCDKLMRSY